MKILLLLLIPVGASLILEFASWVAMGKLLSLDFTDRYFKKNWETYAKSHTDGGSLIYSNGAFFIARDLCLTSRWYIQGIGRVPRWSNWSKKLDELAKELNEKYWTEFNQKYL